MNEPRAKSGFLKLVKAVFWSFSACAAGLTSKAMRRSSIRCI